MSTLPTTSDEILASTRSLIVSGGYSAFSYADIAEVVGIRKASIHHHFPSKADLVRTMLVRYRQGAEIGLGQMVVSMPDPRELLLAYAGMWSKCIEDSTIPFCACAVLAAELPALPPEVALEVRAYFRFLSSWLTALMEKGAEQGILRIEGSPEIEAEAFMATVHGAMLLARARGTPFLFSAIVTSILRRLSAPPAAERMVLAAPS